MSSAIRSTKRQQQRRKVIFDGNPAARAYERRRVRRLKLRPETSVVYLPQRLATL